VVKGILFLVAVAIILRTGQRLISELGGLARVMGCPARHRQQDASELHTGPPKAASVLGSMLSRSVFWRWSLTSWGSWAATSSRSHAPDAVNFATCEPDLLSAR
jgi:hypothetical protein